MLSTDQISIEVLPPSQSVRRDYQDTSEKPRNGRKQIVTAGTYRIERRDNLRFIRTLDDEQVKLIVTSPPYNLGKTNEKRTSIKDYLKWAEAGDQGVR